MNDSNRIKSTIASRLATARKNAGLSQSQVAQLMEMHRPSISEIEAGRRKVSAEELYQFARIYKVDLNWLTGHKEPDSDKIGDELLLAARKLRNLRREDLQAVVDFISTVSSEPEKES